MKKLFFLSLTVFFITVATAQLTPRVEKNIIVRPATKIIKTNPVPPPAPAPAINKETPEGDQTTSVYTLSSVRVNIKTGSDNKEFPSQVYI